MIREANKLFNLLLPFTQYKELRNLGIKINKPIAEIVREGIPLVFEKYKKVKE